MPFLFPVLLGVGVSAAAQTPAPAIDHPILVEVGAFIGRDSGLLDMLLAVSDDDADAAERELKDALADRPWLRVVSSGGEVGVAVNRSFRSISSQSRSKDGKETTISFHYEVRAGIGTRSDRGSIEADTTVSHTYSQSSGHQYPSRSDDRTVYERLGRELAGKARDWILPRIAALRPHGPDAGFEHRTRFRWLLKGDGLEVLDVAAGSPAEQAGLRVGDRIRKIDREDGTVQMDERVRTWRLEPPGTRVLLEVERDRKRSTMPVELRQK